MRAAFISMGVIACVSLLQVPTGAQVALPANGALLVLAKADQTLALVDPVSLKVLGKVPSGPDPHEVVTSSDGRTAYIANYNGGGNIISVIDLSTMTARAPINLGALRAPHGLDFKGGKLWFTAELSKLVGSYDPGASAVDWVMGTGQNRTHMIYVFPDLQHIVTSNVSSATMTFLDRTAGARGRPAGAAPALTARGGGPGGAQGDWEATVVPVGRGAEGFDVSPDGKELWAANAQDGTVSVIDIATKKVTQTIAANVTGANRLKFTPDGTHVLVSTLSGPDVIVFTAATRAEAKRIPVGRGAAGIQIQPDGARAYVACPPDDYVAIIDLKRLAVAGRVDAGRQPDGMAWARGR